MIKINKSNTIPKIKVFTEKKSHDNIEISKAEKELNDSIVFFDNQENYKDDKKLNEKEFKYQVYKDKELVKKLTDIFKDKCAYCDSVYKVISPEDIDHFRPKNKIVTKDKKELRPGYYWLAGDWNNLLISCIHCNRAHKHPIPGELKDVTRGKEAQFPLSDESYRIRNHTDDIATEEEFRLLINPCIEDPEQLLTYDEFGLIYPKNKGDLKAEYSIFVYALQRSKLVEARKEVLASFIRKLELMRKPARELYFAKKEKNAPLTEELNKQLRLHFIDISYLFRHKQPYLGVLRDYIRKTKNEDFNLELMNIGINLEKLIR